jgi:hypothetical protein
LRILSVFIRNSRKKVSFKICLEKYLPAAAAELHEAKINIGSSHRVRLFCIIEVNFEF